MKKVLPLLILLGGCAPHLINLPRLHASKPAPVAQTAVICPGGLSADLESAPKLPKDAGFPAPTTEAAAAAVKLYLGWLKDYADWAKEGWGRAADAKAFCEKSH